MIAQPATLDRAVPTRMTASEAFVETLAAEGVTLVPGIVGSAYMDALDLFPRAQAKSIDLGVEGGSDPLTVEGNPVLLREMIKNLVDNAIKYTPVGGRVTANTRYAGAPILEVEDTGVGIPEADRERVFERFYRVLGSGEDGSGLGLPIVREIAELHRATVTLNPNPAGHGTIVQVVFPRGHVPPPIQVYGDFPLG